MEMEKGVTKTRELTPIQWQLMMKCWKMNLRPGQYSWWGPTAWKIGSMGMWLYKLRKLNGPNFTYPLLMFTGILSEKRLVKMGKIYEPQPLETKNRQELLETIRPKQRQFVRADTGDIPEGYFDQKVESVNA
jgi:hypothetical protein